MTASITKITAGSGYEYLTRQVARMDATSEAGPGLAAYYSEKGEAPGRWVGTGLTGMGGLAAGDEVTAGQMWNLFGVGYHPLAWVPQMSCGPRGRIACLARGNARLGGDTACH